MGGLRGLEGQLDWNDVRYFLAVTRRRTLARAARRSEWTRPR